MDDDMRFDGKVALITGAGRGLGRAYALALAARGCRIVVNDLGTAPIGGGSEHAPAEEVVAEIAAAAGEAISDFGDVATDAEAIVGRAIDAYGRLDIVINNAGTVRMEPFANVSEEQFDGDLAVHVLGSVNIARAAWPHLVASGSGRIVNVSSSGVWGVPGMASYMTSKAGVIGLTRALALDGAADGINVNAVMPLGMTRLQGTLPPEHPIAQALTKYFMPETAAPVVLWLSHASTAVSGEVFSIGGGRAARVVLAQGTGVIPAANTPEGWRECASELMSVRGLLLHRDCQDEVIAAVRDLSAAL